MNTTEVPGDGSGDSASKPEDPLVRWTRRTFYVVLGYTAVSIAVFLVGFCSLRTANNNFIYGERPNVSLNDIAIYNVPGGIGVVPRWENSGNTSTQVEAQVVFQFSRDPLPDGFFLVEPTGPPRVPFVLGPKEASSAQYVTLPYACIDNIKRQIFRYLYVWGVARYTDELSGHDRITRFCWEITGTLPVNVPDNPERFQHGYCEKGNCADDKCKEYDAMPVPKLPQDVCVVVVPPVQPPKAPGAEQPPAQIPPAKP